MNRLEAHATADLVQARLLGAIFSHSLRGEVALKGGFAMRVMAGSTRYTKDIDLAASPAFPARAVQSCICKAVGDLRNSGLVSNLSLTAPKQTDTTQRWKIQGTVGSQEIHLTVEVSRRDRIDASDLKTANYQPMPGSGLGSVAVACVSLPSLAAAKVDCLANPVREAPRDIYDLFLLIKMDVVPSPDALKAYGHGRLVQMRDMMWSKIEKMDYEEARAKLLGFLPADKAVELTEAVWDEMRLVVEERVRGWIDDALMHLDGGFENRESEHEELAQVPA